ncbi:NAD-dependent epimerase/dehydratase family protein [Mesorhizobium sp. B2-4-4]|uniref:NAD-dependent epimerase/dehydratase family protein n=1 Tax=Mesorhizobium sp. B2-4-4 TaxID=2589945 RepID=UPI001126EA59|nr:NAD-dependent epimerase/dehydratase family protein [Mesorhizobium sp. B2-4-4]TPL56491.1 NAD-dependent epimerase/dehydratase family protein [Mesorhizobium sp. B2-4-4]
MKSVLVAGAAGFIGSHLVDRLLLRQEINRIVAVDNFWTGTRANLDHIADPRLVVVDVAVEDFQQGSLFDEIYHLASPASPPWYMQDPVRTISANVIGTMRLLTLLRAGGRFCFTSTSEVYGDPLVTPQPETYRGSVDCTGPRSSYDEGKRCAEALLFESNRLSGLDIRVARLFNVYGPRTRPDDGRAVSNFITNALFGKPIIVFGDGLQSRSWGYVSDIVDGLEQFFWGEEHGYIGPLNIGNDREISVVDVARYVAGLVPGTKIVHVDPIPQDPTNRCPDLTLARRIIPGWACQIPLEEGVRLTLDWFRHQQQNDLSSVSSDSMVAASV